jgi:hypothetical protein
MVVVAAVKMQPTGEEETMQLTDMVFHFTKKGRHLCGAGHNKINTLGYIN